MMFGSPNWVSAETSPIPSPYPNDPNATILMGYDQFHLQLVPLMSPQDSFYSNDMILTFDKERISVPDPTMYQNKHIKRLVEVGGLLEEAKSDLTIVNLNNDFQPLLDLVMEDITQKRSSTISPIEELQVLKIIELAERSAIKHCRMDLG